MRLAHRMLTTVLLYLGLSSIALAVEDPVARFKSGDQYTRAAMYIEGNSILMVNAVNLSVEYRAAPWLAISGGGGLGVSNLVVVSYRTIGGRVMAHAVAGKRNNHFEAALGAGVYTFQVIHRLLNDSARDSWAEVLPEAFIGYRYQPSNGGILVRFGLGITHSAPGLNASIGYSF